LFGVSVSKRAWLGVLTVLLWLPSVAAPQVSPSKAGGQAKAPPLDTIVQSLEATEQQNPARTSGYTVTQSYKLFQGDKIEPVSQTVAEVSFVPSGKTTYKITESSGSDRGKKMVRDILDLEVAPVRKSSEISSRNYKFAFLQQELLGGSLTYLLRIIPKRKENYLFNGFVWVDAKAFRVERIEGTPVKKPSWLIKDLDITLQYADVDGLWLPTYIRAAMDVRFAASYLLTGENVGLRLSAPDAEKGAAGQQ
jgi:hypothetical protein